MSSLLARIKALVKPMSKVERMRYAVKLNDELLKRQKRRSGDTTTKIIRKLRDTRYGPGWEMSQV